MASKVQGGSARQDGALVGYWGLKSSGITTITPSAPAVLRTGSNGSAAVRSTRSRLTWDRWRRVRQHC